MGTKTGQIKKKTGILKRVAVISLAVIMTLGVQMLSAGLYISGNAVYANSVGITKHEMTSMSGTQGESNAIAIFKLTTNEANISYGSAKLTISSDVTISGGSGGGSIPSGEGGTEITFFLDINKYASTGDKQYTLTLNNVKRGANVEEETKTFTGTFEIYENLSAPGATSGTNIAAADISHSITPTGGFSTGSDNSLGLEVYNRGTSAIRDAEISLTLPEGISVYNDSNSTRLGSISTSTKRSTKFPIFVDDTVVSGNYAIIVKLSGLDSKSNTVSIEKTFYIPITGGSGNISATNLAIQNAYVPAEVTGTEPFTLTFSVKNTSTSTIKNMKVSVDVPEGLLNRTTNTFIENTFEAGASKNYSVSFFSQDGVDKTYPIKILVEPVSEGKTNVIQYVSVYVKGDSSTAKTPQLMVAQYTYGGSHVQAGSRFSLNLGLYNTSGKTLSNVKVTLGSDDGTFVPVDSSSAFFVDSIGAKNHYTKAMYFSTKPTAEQQTTSMNVKMTYEADGNTYESTDIIAIPVTQETKLEIDDIVPPFEVYAFEMGSAEVDFYNTGKNTINNLSVNVEGNFDVAQSNRYYVGNMESGRSDSYTFTYIPREVGPMEGVITFTYEDGGGQQQYLEVPFVFEAMEMPVWNEMDILDEEAKPKPWGLIIGGSVIVLVVAGLIVWRKLRKRKLHKAMEILDAEDDAQFDLEAAEVEEEFTTIEEAPIEHEGVIEEESKRGK